MRPILAALLAGATLSLPARAGDLRNFDDAALRAVHFVDANEGWAVGDEGVVWHTIDGGKEWERQPTGVRASLRSVQFLNPFTGWIAGREELPHGTGSVGVLLFTNDGGLRWQRVAVNAFPGLNVLHFTDPHTGYALGDGTDHYPTGIFRTTDGGRNWKPVAGPRCPTWHAADFSDAQTGVLVGAWGRAMVLRQGTLAAADLDDLHGRSLAGVRVVRNRAVAVGQGGLVLVSKDTAGERWGYGDAGLAAEVRACWDLHALHGSGDQLWAVGRPGTVVLHSTDRGQTWEVQKTGQPLPLHGLFFRDTQQGWAVGELGSILSTADGGRSWRVQRRGGQQAAVLFVHARPTGLPVDTMAQLGGEDGYLTTAVRVLASDPASAAPGRSAEEARFTAAVRQAGGAAGEVLWQFPVPQHLLRADRADLLGAWGRLHGTWDRPFADHAAEQLLRQVVFALRLWQPRVVVTDNPDPKAGLPVEALVTAAVKEAFAAAADPKAYPEQIAVLGLEPCRAAKLYAGCSGRAGAQVVLDATSVTPRLEAAARDFAVPAFSLLADVPGELPGQRCYQLLASRVDGAAGHRELMQGIALNPGGLARRNQPAVLELSPEKTRVLQARRNFEIITQALAPSEGRVRLAGLADPARVLARVGPALATMPDDAAVAAGFALANQYVRMGQWPMAHEVYQILVERYPAHPLAADAYRWLIRYHASTEARRRSDLKQFVLMTDTSYHQLEPGGVQQAPAEGPPKSGTPTPHTEVEVKGELALLNGHTTARQWYQGCLDFGLKLDACGPIFVSDPSTQFCLQAARRNLGDFDGAQKWYARFQAASAAGPWRDAAAAECWLANRTGPPPRPALYCRFTELRPFLDGRFDDSCWQGLKPTALKNAVGDTVKDYPTEVRLAHDADFLYLAVRCQHPADRYVPPVAVRTRDADLRRYDRVSLLLDLDRDYATYFQLQVDQRGCVCEDCWGDPSWDPRWFVSVNSTRTGWQMEAAIPLAELTGDAITPGHAWACNVVRVLPGRGVQAFSVPADVQPRPEGMGLLLFTREQQATKLR